jgi:N-terminal domain of ribose phosphate pyrophosphokinase
MNSALMNGTTDGAFTIFSGTSNSALAGAIARILCVPLGERTIERFPDGEVAIWIGESVRRKEVFIVQPTSPPVDSLYWLPCSSVPGYTAPAARSLTTGLSFDRVCSQGPTELRPMTGQIPPADRLHIYGCAL